MKPPITPVLRTLAALLALCLPLPGCGGDGTPGGGAGAADGGEAAASRSGAAASTAREAGGAAPATGSASPASGDPALTPHVPRPGETVRDRATDLDLDAAFATVARGIGWEPYAGILRGPEGTAAAGSGNAADQALLLAEILRRSGYTARLVRGRLGDANAAVLVRGMYPVELPGLDLGSEYGPYDPADDAGLMALTRDHFWVEVDQGDGSWLPLDPSFPRAVAGEAYARPSERYDELPDELHQRVRITLRESTADGRQRELGVIEGRAADLGMRPITVAVRAVPLIEPGREGGSPGQVAGGIAGALGGGGGAAEPEEPPVVGVAWERRGWVAGRLRVFEPTSVRYEHRDGFLRREWLEIELTAPGLEPVELERTLFDAAWARERNPDRSAEPAEVRRYGIAVLPGPVRHLQLHEAQAWWRTRLAVDRWEGDAARFASAGGNSGAEDLGRIEEASGAAAGHLLPLAFAAESDSVTRILARGAGVAVSWDRPRLLVFSTETRQAGADESAARLSLDLRYDEVSAYPWPGAPIRAAHLFRMARGIQESVLEGEVLSRASGIQAVVTTPLVMGAREEDNELRVIPAGAPGEVESIAGLPQRCATLVSQASRSGRSVVIPSRPVRIGGRDVWGWWEVDAETGSVIGVLEDGEHQAAATYGLTEDEALDPDMGRVIGGFHGAASTSLFIAAGLLRYGTVTGELLDAVEAWVKTLACHACPQVGMSLGAQYKFGDCFSYDPLSPPDGTTTFCEGYHQGFECAAGTILNALRGQTVAQAMSVEGGAGISFGCELKGTWKVDGEDRDEGSMSYAGGKVTASANPGGS